MLNFYWKFLSIVQPADRHHPDPIESSSISLYFFHKLSADPRQSYEINESVSFEKQIS
jgi:hypothetical protein